MVVGTARCAAGNHAGGGWAASHSEAGTIEDLESHGRGGGAAGDPGVKNGQGDGSGDEEEGTRFVSRPVITSRIEIITVADPDRAAGSQAVS